MPHHEYTEETQAKLKALQELIEQQADLIRSLQSKLLDARLGTDRQRIEPQVEGEQ